MDMRLEPFNLNRQSYKWVSVLIGSLFLWITPIGLRAPKLLIFLSLPTAISGFGYCAISSASIKERKGYNSKLALLLNELENFEFALKEQALRDQLEVAYNFFNCEPILENGSGIEPERLNPSDVLGSSGSEPEPGESDESDQTIKTFTIHRLPEKEAALLVRELQNQGFSKAAVIRELWGATKGGGKPYRVANEEFDHLAKLGR
jgi:hypothetical protein